MAPLPPLDTPVLAVHLCLLHCMAELGADSSAVGLYCVTIAWFTSSYDDGRSVAILVFLKPNMVYFAIV